ncbi:MULTISPECIES: type II secretion system F family protein [unclassified Halomonas]|uniref:type II secretion system F family protein n=1 Tax=unclassified Halomonas TaxID=2609666 RepID=UPI001C977445|nr:MULTISPECIES: type II secretion system F family protein [unclassified Halomonas]MBY5926367.1 type II secretion system F family protein [Halomonas sp. DP4Y7-2]MBY6233409.1 type II secretion system F family protein [Halomonas sp. DP4Y7-1]
MNVWVVFSLVAACLATAAWLLMKSARAHTERAAGGQRTARRRSLVTHDSLMEWLVERLTAAGLPASPLSVAVAGGSLLVLAMLLLSRLGAVWGPATVVLVVVLANALIRVRAARTRRRARRQLAPFLSQVSRGLVAGQGLEAAFVHATRRVRPPLSDALSRVMLRRQLGQELDEGLAREGQILRLDELGLLATAMRINQRHGGSLSDMLDAFAAALHQREQSGRELAAMTGETRISALVLGLSPLLLTLFIQLTQPAFLLPMLESSGGRQALALAVVLQLSGGWLLWRMLKSV